MIQISQQGNVKIGKFDTPSRLTLLISEDVKAELKPVLSDDKTNLIFNLENVDFIDSSGIGCLISLQNTAAQHNSRIAICNISKSNMKIFDLLHLDKILELYPTLDEALKKF
ncbi:MAG: STAS domain-containing protein [Culturomica sp.]|jgi:anti-anti-sigma factor|nr:STAS domain-containing protein [Culturomica sp.]